jgi:hypothetical protein
MSMMVKAGGIEVRDECPMWRHAENAKENNDNNGKNRTSAEKPKERST